MFILVVYAFLILFYVGLFLGESFNPNKRNDDHLGKKLYEKKSQQLANSPLFKPLRKLDEKGNFSIGFILVFVLILIKSIAFFFIGLILIAPLILIVQGFMMGRLVNYHKNAIGPTTLLKMITYFQLFSHIVLATIGTLNGYKWIMLNEISIKEALQPDLPLIIALIVSIVFALIASRLELSYIKNQLVMS